jgi:hypothetical protein
MKSLAFLVLVTLALGASAAAPLVDVMMFEMSM